MRLIEVLDGQRRRVAVLDNAFDISETEVLNGISEMSFSLPDGDEKARYLDYRMLIRFDGGQLYRVVDYTAEDDGAPVLSYMCEHVAAGLCDRVMYGDHVRSGYTTRQNIEYILSFQSDWVLGDCDFAYQYDYGWTSENLLAALFSIATPFTDYYKFVFDTAVYPWRIHLHKIETGSAEYYVFREYNFLRSRKKGESGEVVTRLYLQGYGEGVNQLGVSQINGGKPYIDASDEAMRKYGLIERVYTDRKQKEPASLLAAGKALLKEGEHAREEYEVEAADLKEFGVSDIYKAQAGETILFKPSGFRTYITKIVRNHDTAGDMRLTLANTPEDLVKMLADLADRQRIEATYAQGSTQIWGSVMVDNADASHPLKYPLWIPKELTIMNYVQLRIELGRFRAYSKGASSGGGSSTTSAGGGGGTSGSAGGQSVTSASGGSATVTTAQKVVTNILSVGGPLDSEDGEVLNYVEYASAGTTGGPSDNQTSWTTTPAQGTDHLHYMKSHTHSGGTHRHYFRHFHTGSANLTIPEIAVNIPSHKHTVSVGNHTHTVPSHTHTVSTPTHTHAIDYGIYESTEQPVSATVSINGQTAFAMEKEWEGDISSYLIDNSGKMPRGRFVTIEVRPNTLARCTVAAAPQGFIQSKGGGQY